MLYTILAALQETHEAAGSHAAEGFGSPFEVNFGLFFWTWLVFISLFLVLKKFAWPSIVKLTEERERAIQKQLDDAERANAEAKATLEQHKQLMAASKEEARVLVAEAKDLAEKERERLLGKTREEQEGILERAKREIQAERERAVAILRRETVDLSLAAASKLIQERLTSEADRKIVEDYLGAIGEIR
jgi:F-type H+-transporting ATPase subunit b